ncbi:MAG TPA: outer membrane beta-barrel protein [Chryseolinea sp.]|nr:outer membrane beta-barrel protein [Chryseolinea sp.]
MRKLRLLLIVGLFITQFDVSFAQVSVHVGATTAYNATFVLDKGLSEDPRYSSTITYNWAPIGFNVGVDFSKTFGLSLESILSHQGQIYEIIDVAEKVVGQRTIDLSYVNLPLLMRFMSGGNGGTRANFNLGPQLSFLTDASEVMQYKASTLTLPPGAALPPGATNVTEHPDGSVTADVPAQSPKEVMSKEMNSFKNTEFQIAGAFGLDIDLAKHLYLSTQIRATYSLTDMRNGDVIETIKDGKTPDIFGQRANLAVGVQLGVHYVFGSTRSFKYKGAK